MECSILNEGAATVIHIAAHFETLQQRASELARQSVASKRGYFTPTEDEAVRHLLISYTQSRNALVELVTSYHRGEEFDRLQRPVALTIAFAGALVLVDGARFLREKFHDKPIVRRKLNEPEPNFGIEIGTYDRIQRSLTNPRHAWHLYHAWRFTSQNWAELQTYVQTLPSFGGVLELIQQLQHRIDVTADRFILARSRSHGRALRSRLGRDLLGKGLYGLQKCVSRLLSERYLISGHTPQLPPQVETEMERLMAPGDVIITRKEHALTNYFLPGYWPHAAFYVGSVSDLERMELHRHENVKGRWPRVLACDANRPGRVLESLKDGVRIRSLSCPFASDAVAVIRPNLPASSISRAIGRSFFHDGKPYDFDFDFTRSDRMVCTEVVYRALDGIDQMEFPLTVRAGRMTLSAEDLLTLALGGKGFQVVAAFCPSRDRQVLRDQAAATLVKETLN